MHKKLLITIIIFIPLLSKSQLKTSFIEEYIDFTITDSTFEVNGVYVFVNLSDKDISQRISFPYQLNSDSTEIQRIYNLSYLQTLKYQQSQQQVSFSVPIAPKDTVKVNIAYRQPLQRRNVYILKSTATWGRALEKAKYSLEVSENISISNLSYMPDSQQENMYFWEKTNFMPSEDFIVELE